MPSESATGSSEAAMAAKPQQFGFLLLPQYSMMALSSATEPLRSANYISGKPLYEWHLLTPGAGNTASSSLFEINAQTPLADAPPLDMLFVVASLGVVDYFDEAVFDWLRQFAASGKPVGGISLGTLILARAGLLKEHYCTIHWDSLRAFALEFPQIDLRRDLYCIDRGRLTCGGGTSGMDMMLDLIARVHGKKFAIDVADQFLYTRLRTSTEGQKMSVQWRYGIDDRRLVKALTLMEQNIETPIAMHVVASLVGVSSRQFERLWVQNFDESPSRFYMTLRLKAAQKLLQESTYSLHEVAMQCGFATPSHLGRFYRQLFGHTPGQERKGRH